MKKTIAKIMAAALVLSSFTVPNVSATVVNGKKDVSEVKLENEAKLPLAIATADPTLDVDFAGLPYVVDGVFNEDAYTSDFTWELNDTGLAKLISDDYSTSWYYEDDVRDTVDASIQVEPTLTSIGDGGTLTYSQYTYNASTPVSARSAIMGFDNTAAQWILSDFTGTKTDINGGTTYRDVTIARNLDGTDLFVEDWYLAADGNWYRDRWINRTAANYATRVELARQISVANFVTVPRTIRVQDVNGNWRSIGQRWFTLSTNASVVDDDYWNAIVKLKADRNRYTPIRVHVDVVDGSLKGLTGLYVQVVNGTVVPWGYRTYGTNSLLTTQVADNRLVINDVQDNDLALLRSDVAKGKRLMLDNAFVFSVTGLSNNNSLTGAGDAVYDFSTLGEDTDWDTISIGKIQDVRSRIFKECKEKEVHAENLKWVRNGTFRKNKMMKKAILSDKVSMKKINEKAFYDCKRLKAVKVKVNSLKQVGKNAFGGSTDKKGLKFNLKAGSKAKFNKAVKLFKKSGVKKAHFKKI